MYPGTLLGITEQRFHGALTMNEYAENPWTMERNRDSCWQHQENSVELPAVVAYLEHYGIPLLAPFWH